MRVRRPFDQRSFIDGSVTKALVEQVNVVDVARLGQLAGSVSPEELWGIDSALQVVLDLPAR